MEPWEFEFSFTFSPPCGALVIKPFADIPLYILRLDWKHVCYSNRSKKKVVIVWLPPLISSTKLNFNKCSLGHRGWLGIGDVIRDHLDTALRGYSKHVGAVLAIEVEILALLDLLLQVKASCLSNLIVEGDSITVVAWVSNRERGSWMFDNLMCKIINIASELSCSFSWVTYSAN